MKIKKKTLKKYKILIRNNLVQDMFTPKLAIGSVCTLPLHSNPPPPFHMLHPDLAYCHASLLSPPPLLTSPQTQPEAMYPS